MGRSTASTSAVRRLAGAALGVGVAVFAVQGGEYGTLDLLHQRSRRAALRAHIDTLQHQVDSLTRLAHAISTDPAVQERIAREEFGMVRGPKELLYRFAPARQPAGTPVSAPAPSEPAPASEPVSRGATSSDRPGARTQAATPAAHPAPH